MRIWICACVKSRYMLHNPSKMTFMFFPTFLMLRFEDLNKKKSLQHLNSVFFPVRHYYTHLSLPQDHCEGGRYSYMSSSPRDTVDIGHQVTK